MALSILKSFIWFMILTFIYSPGVRLARKEKLTRKDILTWFVSAAIFFVTDYIWTIGAWMVTGTWLMPWDALELITGSFILKTLLRISVYIIFIGLYLVLVTIATIHAIRKSEKEFRG